MRPIKFRAKDNTTGEWRYGVPVQTNYGISMVQQLWHIDGAEYNANEYMVDSDTVGEFTGLFDKNGKEVYEGDVIAIDDHMKLGNLSAVIIFDDGAFQMRITFDYNMHGILSEDQDRFDATQDRLNKWKVISNIYEK